jgi:hypothetical protein
VQINSTQEERKPGEPSVHSVPLASLYFHVREIKDGYLITSAAMQPDSTCNGKNLMPAPAG